MTKQSELAQRIKLGDATALEELNAAPLNERERETLRMYYGIGTEKLTLQEIGDCYGLTPERVRKIKEKALRRLKHGIRFSPFQTDILTTLRPLR